MYQDKIFACKGFLIFQVFTKVLKMGFFGLSKRHEKDTLSCNIFIFNLVTLLKCKRWLRYVKPSSSTSDLKLQQFSVKFSGSGNANTGISRFAGFLQNEIILETLIVIFVNNSSKGFSWPNNGRNFIFRFWRRILDIYSQPLLNGSRMILAKL